MKIALVIGHHRLSKGAYSPYLKVKEFDFYDEVVDFICQDVDVVLHNPLIPSYTRRIKDTARRLDKGRYDLVISLHFNAFHNNTANGCETLVYYKSRLGKKYGKLFNEVVTTRTNIKDRGIRPLANADDRGYGMVFYPSAPVILVEPFFGTNPADCARIQDAHFMASLLDEFIIKARDI